MEFSLHGVESETHAQVKPAKKSINRQQGRGIFPPNFKNPDRLLEDAIRRGGRQAWFNRLRSSLSRVRRQPNTDNQEFRANEYLSTLISSLDELCERKGKTLVSIGKYLNRIVEDLGSSKHDKFANGLGSLGELLGYKASRPKYPGATDCQWRGVFGSHREVITFEAKIEHKESRAISLEDLGQVHNQNTRTTTEYGEHGYEVRSCLVTHLTKIQPDAGNSIGSTALVSQMAIQNLCSFVSRIIVKYRELWRLEDVTARRNASDFLRRALPQPGWLLRVLQDANPWIRKTEFTSEWPKR